MKWHDVVVHKNVFRDCVKHVTMQRCHTVQYNYGFICSGKAGMTFWITSVHDDPMWRATQFKALLPCWMLIADGRELAVENCAPYSARHSGLPQKFQRVGYAIEFPICKSGTAMQSHRPCWTDTTGTVTTFLDEASLWTKPGLAHTNQT